MKKIDYLNPSKYLQVPTNQQGAMIGHVNYIIDELSKEPDTEYRHKVVWTPLGLIPPAVGVQAIPNIEISDIFLLDMTELDPSTTEVYIDLRDADGGSVQYNPTVLNKLAGKQLWFKQGANSANVTVLQINGVVYPLGVTPPFSFGQDVFDCVTIQAGVGNRSTGQTMIAAVATLGFPSA